MRDLGGTRSRRLRGAGALLATLALTGCAATATADVGPAIWRQADGSVAIDASRLRPAYHGHYLTDDDPAAQGLPSAVNRELACQGIVLLFDSETELQAYLDDYDRRHPVTTDSATLAPGVQPCDAFTDSPRYVADE